MNFVENFYNMNLMKRFLITLLIGLITSSVFAQSRVNRTKYSFIDSSEKIFSATGWSYNEILGEWIDYENVISDDKTYKERYKTLQGSYMMSRIKQNFIDIMTKSLIVDGQEYFIVMVKKWNGKYRYPAIYEDWIYWEEVQGFIFTKEEYSKILDFSGKIQLVSNNYVSHGSFYENYDEQVFLDLIQNELKSENWYVQNYKFPILKTDSDGSEVIRFYVPQSFGNDEINFDKKYFETSTTNFDKLILK